MNERFYRRLFLCVLFASILVDFSFDLLALKQSYVSEEAKASVESSTATVARLADISFAVREFVQARLDGDLEGQKRNVESLRFHFASYKSLTPDDSPQATRFRPYEFILRPSEGELDKFAAVTRRMSKDISIARVEEQELLIERMRKDGQAILTSRNEIFLASVLDFFLIAAAGLAWVLFERRSHENERMLRKSIHSSETTIVELRRVLEKKAAALRTTVHDLKNPLGSIKGFSGLIAEECADAQSVAEMSQSLQRLSDHTLSLVNSLLEVESKSIPIETHRRLIHPVSYIEDVALSLKPQLLAKSQSLVTTHEAEDIEIYGDPKKLWDLFMNLIGNAVKYSPLHSTIHVRSFRLQEKIGIEIEDEGPGFSAEDKEKAFGQFQTLSARPTGGESSTGLGLSLALETVNEMGGTISILDGKNNRGARILVQLPTKPSRPLSPSAQNLSVEFK